MEVLDRGLSNTTLEIIDVCVRLRVPLGRVIYENGKAGVIRSISIENVLDRIVSF